MFVLARNVLLLSLIADGDDKGVETLWSVYYDFYMTGPARLALRLQAKKLYDASESMDAWQQSQYGSYLRFCDTDSLADVRKMWHFYAQGDGEGEDEDIDRRLKSVLQPIAQQRAQNKNPGEGPSKFIGTFRATIPTSINTLDDLDALHKRYWEHGSLKPEGAKYPNPMFLTLGDEATFHRGTDPLHGFHLAPAYAPLHPDSPWAAVTQGLAQPEAVVAVAQKEFEDWITSFRKNLSNMTLRFCVGDALSMAHTLHQLRMTGADRAGWYRNQYCVQLLILNGPDYAAKKAPLDFDVIDTSNLCDYVGPLCLFAATSRLLRSQPTSILYAEVHLKRGRTYQEIIEDMLCGDVPIMSSFLGLFPLEFCTNTSSISYLSETLYDVIAEVRQPGAASTIKTSDQIYLRTSWKRPPGSAPGGLQKMVFGPRDLALVLHAVYKRMFRWEGMMLDYMRLNLGTIQRSSLIWYNHASFASLVSLVKERVDCSWTKMMKALLQLIQNEHSRHHNNGSVSAGQYLPEMFTYLHTLGAFSDGRLKYWNDRHTMALKPGSELARYISPDPPAGEAHGDLRDWKDVPPIVCVSLQVPRSALSVFTSMNRARIGTPTLYCFIKGPDNSGTTCYSACQLAFGEITTKGTRHSTTYEVTVQEDPLAWKGSSALIVSFYAPVFALLPGPDKMEVALGICETPVSAAIFRPTLGHAMKVHGASLEDSGSVFVSRHAPNQADLPAVPGFVNADLEPAAATEVLGSKVSKTLRAEVGLAGGRVENFILKVGIESHGNNAALKVEDTDLKSSSMSPCQYRIALFGTPEPERSIDVRFPAMVTNSTLIYEGMVKRDQNQGARDQGLYIDVNARVGGAIEWRSHPLFMYPVDFLRNQRQPANWNTPYLSLRHCPIVDHSAPPESLGWFDVYVSGMFSARERELDEHGDMPREQNEQARLSLKISLLQIMLQFAGVMDEDDDEEDAKKPTSKEPEIRRRIFGLRDPENPEGDRILIIPSAVRLDPASRNVVLDCAVLPLDGAKKLAPTSELLTGIGKLLPARDDGKGPLKELPALSAEMQLWKHTLPAWVERCRSSEWEHRADCEYATSGQVQVPEAHQSAQGGKFLCSCGNGRFPAGYLDDTPGWAEVQHHAVRAAISPVFWAPFADDPFRPSPQELAAMVAHAARGSKN